MITLHTAAAQVTCTNFPLHAPIESSSLNYSHSHSDSLDCQVVCLNKLPTQRGFIHGWEITTAPSAWLKALEHDLKHCSPLCQQEPYLSQMQQLARCSTPYNVQLQRITFDTCFESWLKHSWISVLGMLAGAHRWCWWNHSGFWMWYTLSSQSLTLYTSFLWHTESSSFPKDTVVF